MPGGIQHQAAAAGGGNAHLAGGHQQGAGLAGVNLRQLLLRQLSALPGHVQILPAAHAVQSHGAGQDFGAGSLSVGRKIAAEDGAKGLGLEGVPRQDGGAFAIDHMVGRAAPAQIVIIHAGKIIMDQAVCMQHFNGAGHRQGRLHIAAGDAAELQHQNGADPLAAGQQAIAHGLGQAGLGIVFRQGEVLRQGSIDPIAVFVHSHFNSHPQRAVLWVRGQAPFLILPLFAPPHPAFCCRT